MLMYSRLHVEAGLAQPRYTIYAVRSRLTVTCHSTESKRMAVDDARRPAKAAQHLGTDKQCGCTVTKHASDGERRPSASFT